MKKIVIGFIIGCLLMTTPVLAESFTKTIEVVFDSVNVQINGKDLDANSILYNGTTYLPVRKVAEAVGKNIIWNQQTMTANIVDEELPEIVDYGFKPQGNGNNFYLVKFSDGFIVALQKDLNNTIFPNFYQSMLAIDFEKVQDKNIIKPTITGFNKDDNFNSIKFESYSIGWTEANKDDFSKFDFFKNFENINNESVNVGGLLFFLKPIDGITYDDGIHKCTLYLETN